MKAGWATKTLGQLCQLISGQHIEAKDYNTDARGVGYLTGPSDFGPVNPIVSKWTEHPKVKARNGDILITVKGSGVGKVNLLDQDEVAISRQLMAVRVTNADPRFVYSFLCSKFDHFQSLSTGAAIPGISREQVLGLEFGVPPLSEQQRIVGILDEAFDGIATAKANAERNLLNARALFESHLQSVFTQRGEGWVEKPLGEVCDLLNGFAFKSEDAVSQSMTQLVRMGNLYGNKLNLDRVPVFYPDKFATAYQRYLLKEGDLIMSLTGTTGKEDYGYTVRIPDCSHELLMNQRIAKFDSIKHDLVDRNYLLHYLRSRAFLDILYPTANGTRQANLSSVTIKMLPIPLCPIKAQKEVSAALDELDEETQHLESIYQQKLAALDELKKSLLHQAFTGQL